VRRNNGRTAVFAAILPLPCFLRVSVVTCLRPEAFIHHRGTEAQRHRGRIELFQSK